MTIRISTDKSCLVDTELKWQKIDKDTPIGVKMLLINREYGCATVGIHWGYPTGVFTHWAPLPTFKKEIDIQLNLFGEPPEDM